MNDYTQNRLLIYNVEDMNFLLGAPEITAISIASSVTFVLVVFLICFFTIKNKIKSLNKKCDEAYYALHKALTNRYELDKDLIAQKDSLKKYENLISSISVPVSVSTISDKIEFYKQLMKINDFSLISAEAQNEIHASDDLINESINKYNNLVNHYNKYISSWPNSALAKKFGFTNKDLFIK